MLNEEFFEISRELEQYHAIFYMMWELGKPVFSETISTAAVSFDNAGNVILFSFNEQFWNQLSHADRAFVIAHECMHVILNHGKRAVDSKTMEIANIAMDLVVNHTLVSKFGFSRKKLIIGDGLCWVDTVFPGKEVPTDQTFEYYYNLCKDAVQKWGSEGQSGSSNGQAGSAGQQPLDDHSGLSSFDDDALDSIAENIKPLSEDEISKLDGILDEHLTEQQAGTGLGGRLMAMSVGPVKKKKKWETVIKNWSARHAQTSFKNIEQWARLHRRFAFIDGSLMIPTEMEDLGIEKDKNRIKVWFFQDTSGSCVGLAPRFFKAAASLPTDRFDVKMHCFDTKVYETTLESGKLYGYGGTYFDIIERYIQSQISNNPADYPDAVFVITDGWGNKVTPAQPKKWYWFLSTKYQRYIPDECNIHRLSDFE